TIHYAKTSRLVRFRSPLLPESRLISFPRVTEMVQFTRFASTCLCIQHGIPYYYGGFPHSDIYGSKLVCQLPVAFRRLPRRASPEIAKASIICTYSLDPVTLDAVIGICVYVVAVHQSLAVIQSEDQTTSILLRTFVEHNLFSCNHDPCIVIPRRNSLCVY